MKAEQSGVEPRRLDRQPDAITIISRRHTHTDTHTHTYSSRDERQTLTFAGNVGQVVVPGSVRKASRVDRRRHVVRHNVSRFTADVDSVTYQRVRVVGASVWH